MLAPASLASPVALPALQRFSLPAVFALSGLIMGSWASRIPALSDGLQISHTLLSVVLLCGGLGALMSYPLAARLMSGYGARVTVRTGAMGLCAVLVAIGMAPTVPLLMLAVLMLGVTGGCFGVGLNAMAARYEKAAGGSKMSMLHALGCSGSLCGALLGSALAGSGVAPSSHFVVVAVPAAVLLWVAAQMLQGGDQREEIERKAFALPRGPLALLGLLGFCGAMSENSIADWSGVFLKDHFGASAGVAPLALSAFTVMMLLCRLCGDRLKERHGARRLVSTGATLSACGLFLAVFAPSEWFAMAGFACSGLGLALLFPFIFSAAGQQGAMASASVATMCHVGGLMGPPIVGTVADVLGLQMAIGLIGMLSIMIALVAARSRMLA